MLYLCNTYGDYHTEDLLIIHEGYGISFCILAKHIQNILKAFIAFFMNFNFSNNVIIRILLLKRIIHIKEKDNLHYGYEYTLLNMFIV